MASNVNAGPVVYQRPTEKFRFMGVTVQYISPRVSSDFMDYNYIIC